MQKQRQAPRVQAFPFAASTRALAPSVYPRRRDQVPPGQLKTRRYTLRFANSPSDLKAVQRLRFEVFNLELHEGLESSFALGRDEDDFDAACHHLIVEHRESKAVVGTYRLMTAELAARRGGFYSAGEFDFRGLPEAIQSQGAETGRACVAAEHRSGRVIHLLWKGLARYLAWNNKRFLFGCASVPSTDPSVGLLLAKAFESEGHRHPEVHLEALPALRCEGPLTGDPGRVPPLLQSYLGLGAHIASAPALDRDFKVIDFLVLLDRNNLGPALTRSLFENCTWERTGAN